MDPIKHNYHGEEHSKSSYSENISFFYVVARVIGLRIKYWSNALEQILIFYDKAATNRLPINKIKRFY